VSARRTRVAILGGGPAALAAAFELSATPELRRRYEVTVHQLGWRLGGKCASGRNRARHDRIEEHGLHVWFGFYDNAFALIQRCYEELDRSPDAPLATWRDAFKPSGDVVLYEPYDGRWVAHRVRLPPNLLTPGNPADRSPWDVLADALEALERRWARLLPGPLDHVAAPPLKLLQAARRLVAFPLDDGRVHRRLGVVSRILAAARSLAWNGVVRHWVDHDDLRAAFMLLDLVATVLAGVADDRLLERGWGAINDEELRAWLRRHGASELTLAGSPFLRSVYDGSFSFVDGDKTRPDAAAGKALQDLIRTVFLYKGAFMWKMQAGMGDAVFTPLYTVLRRRGVRFRFFNAVTRLGLSDDRRAVETIDIVEQLHMRRGAYRPLVNVRGLPSWPSEPNWSQVAGGERLAAARVDLEQAPNPLGHEPHTLRRGEDFDEVVLGIPVGALGPICAELAADPGNPRFAAMLEHVQTVMTQAIQLWLRRDQRDLGWPYAEDALTSCFVEPIDTYCDMAHLLDRERWPRAEGVLDVAYFCGPLPHAGLADQAAADRRAGETARAFLEDHVATLWPGSGRAGFDWDALVDPDAGKGPERLAAQYVRANFAGTERYALTTAGSVKHRLWPHESGYENLALAGDWTRNGFDGGSVEAAVTSGMLAAQAISGSPAHVPGLTGWLASDRGDPAPIAAPAA
jgi:uncharacterized protein with NAD-binding domain and iron-sulfur cluster